MPEGFNWEVKPTTRIGLWATLCAGAIGVVAALLQVQGWTMPRRLAQAFIGVLVAIFVFAILMMVFEAIRLAFAYYDFRTTTPSWVATAEPGLLDYEGDGMRTAGRYVKVLNRMARRTAWLNLRMNLYTKVTLHLGPHMSARWRQRLGNRMARAINKHAAYIDKRVGLLKRLVDDLDRNYRGIISNQSFDTDEELAEAQVFRAALEGNRKISGEAADSTSGWQKAVHDGVEMNLSRSLRVASQRLESALGGMIDIMRGQEQSASTLLGEYDQRLEQAQRNRPSTQPWAC
jgi:hypothetical protein